VAFLRSRVNLHMYTVIYEKWCHESKNFFRTGDIRDQLQYKNICIWYNIIAENVSVFNTN